MASPFRTRAAQLHAKVEASWSSTAAADIFAGFNPTFKPNVEENEDLSMRSSFGKYPVIPGGISADLGFSFHLKGSGAAGTAPETDQAWLLCGLAATNTPATSQVYKANISQNSPGSVSWNAGGQRHIVQGAFGTMKISGESGKLVTAEATYKGAYVAVADAAVVGSVTYDATAPRPMNSSTVTIQAIASGLLIKAFSIDLNNNVSLRPSMQASSAYGGAFLGDRNIKGTLALESPDLSTLNFYTTMLAATPAAYSWSWGATAGNICAIAVTGGVPTSVTPSDDNGRLVLAVDWQSSLGAAAAEGDDFTVTFT